MSVLLTEKLEKLQSIHKSDSIKKYVNFCRKLSIQSINSLQLNQEQQKESLQMILISPEYLSWTNVDLFKPIHNVLMDPFIKVNNFRSDVLFKLMCILRYLEEKNFKLRYSNSKLIKINKLQNFLLRLIKCLAFTMNIIIPVERFPLESDFDIIFNSIWKRIWILTDGINMNLYKGSLKYREVAEKIDKWISRR